MRIVPHNIDGYPIAGADVFANKPDAERIATDLSKHPNVDVVLIYDETGIPDSSVRTKD